MTAGQQITWTCTEYNPTGSGLPFGESNVTNNRCVYIAQYCPPADSANPDIFLPVVP